MTLNDRLLQKLANWRPDGPRQILTVESPETGWSATLVADVVETVGIRLWEVSLRQSAAVQTPLVEQANRIASRVTGMMEPLRLVEIDGPRDLAQLRSTAPAALGEALFYYEVLRQTNGTTTVRRYQSSPTSGKREQVAFTLTHEALGKLVSDLTSV